MWPLGPGVTASQWQEAGLRGRPMRRGQVGGGQRPSIIGKDQRPGAERPGSEAAPPPADGAS